MSNILRDSLFFISGAAIASFITYKVIEKKFKDIADEEIESVKAMYERKLDKEKQEKNNEVKNETDTNDNPNKVINPYSSLVNDLGYSNKKEEKKVDTRYDIEVIPPEDFGEYDYKCESLTYYADGVLAYENDEVVTNVEQLVGPNALNTFGEYEDDSVFVRNHDLELDFEILLDTRKYSDVVPSTSVEDTNNDD